MAYMCTEHRHLHDARSCELQIHYEGSEMVLLRSQYSEDYQARLSHFLLQSVLCDMPLWPQGIPETCR